MGCFGMLVKKKVSLEVLNHVKLALKKGQEVL